MNREHISSRPPSYAAYKIDRCRCYRCSAIWSAYDDARSRSIAAGTWQPFMDAAPVREHLQYLRSNGVGLRRVGELIGISRSSLFLILEDCGDRKRRQQVRTERGRAILGLRPGIDTASDGALINAVGTLRRIRALMAIGFPQAFIARHMGMSDGNFSDFAKCPAVTARNARALRAVYDQLSTRNPAALGVPRASITRSSRHAERENWPKPLEWDDDEIDDPTAQPHTGHMEGPQRPRRADALLEDALFIVEHSAVDLAERKQREQVAARLTISIDYLDKLLKTAA